MDDDKLSILNYVFSPTAPIKQRDLFFGRLDQISDVAMTINERGQHAILYGERGVGKTSLANIMINSFIDVLSSKVTCNRTENFKSIWNKALRNIEFYSKEKGIGFKAALKQDPYQLNLFLPPDKEDIDSSDIQIVLEKLDNKLLFIFDEFDSITDKQTKIRFADTIKSLSDNCPNITILIVGIAENISELLGSHQSIERCLKQIKMPRMSPEELGEIIDKGLSRLETEMEPIIRKKIIDYSSGFPNYTHLLCKYSAYSCLQKRTKSIDNIDFNFAVKQALANANEQMRISLQKATISSKGKTQFESVICAVALAETDEYDCSSVTQILKQYNKLTEKNSTRESINYTLSALCKDERGNILEKAGISNNIKYRFKNPLLKAYIKLRLHNMRHQNSLPLK
ncbi:AAA family ATPase [soil metagenome]